MVSDDERREVARRLRGLNGNMWHVRRVYEAAGFSIFCEDQADYYQICDAVAGYLPAEHMHPCDYEELHDRLADLIDPDCEEGRYSVARTVRPVDRDTLLELASTCDSVGDMYAAAHLEAANDELSDLLRKIAELERKTARIIRKAIGVDDG